MSKEFYDALYDIWRNGGNPNSVSVDEVDYYRAKGYSESDACEFVVEDNLPILHSNEEEK